MGGPVGRVKKGGKDFQKGYDPRRNYAGGPKSDTYVNEIKADIKIKLAESLQKYFHTAIPEITKLANDPSLSIGERIAVRFLVETANKGDPSRLSLLAKIVGLEAAPNTQINVNNISLEDLVISANSEMPKEVYVNPNERVVETTASKVIVRRGNKDNE